MIQQIASIALICGSLSVSAQITAHTGESRSAVVSRLGEPREVYAPRTKLTYEPSERALALGSSLVVEDVYSETFGGMEFELRVGYKPDSSSSRLHPTERVLRTTLTPDKTLHFADALSMLPMPPGLCDKGCTMLGVHDGVSYNLFVYPTVPTAAQVEAASRVAHGFEIPSATSTNHWRPCLWFRFIEKPPSLQSALPQFNSLAIDTVSEEVVDPDFEKHMSSGYKEALLP